MVQRKQFPQENPIQKKICKLALIFWYILQGSEMEITEQIVSNLALHYASTARNIWNMRSFGERPFWEDIHRYVRCIKQQQYVIICDQESLLKLQAIWPG